MRPLELTLRDFRSYRGNDAVFDFRGRRLVGIVGPIGSGKSSILDAICFALYGRTPVVAQNTKSLIHQRADGATISLRFEVDGEVWEVVRALRKRGQSQHALYRYPDDGGDSEAIEKVTQEKEVNARIQALLGLDFDAFGRSVLLAQGKFSEFLSSRPGERDKVLKGVFGHDRIDAMREVAKTRAREATAEHEKLSIKVEHLEEVTVRIAAHRVALETLEARIEQLEKSEAAVRDLEEAAKAADGAAREADKALESLAGLASRMPDATKVDRLVADAATADERRTRLGEQLRIAQDELKAVEHALAALETPESAAALQEAASLVTERGLRSSAVAEAAARVVKAEKREAATNDAVAAARERATAAAPAHDSAALAVEAADEAVRSAELARHEAQHADMAATLRAGLAAGDPCPVCEQPVAAPPLARSSVDLAAFDAAVTEAEAARSRAARAMAAASAELKASTEAVDAAVTTAATAAGEMTAARSEAGEADALLRDVDQRLAALLGEGDAAALLAERRRDLDVARKAVTDHRKRVEQARTDHDEAIVAQQASDRALSELRMQVGGLAARLGLEPPPGDAAAPVVATALGEVRSAWAQQSEALTVAAAEAKQAGAASRSELADLLARLEVETTLEAALAGATAEARLHREQVEADERTLADAEALIAARDEAAENAETYARLSSDLTDSRFIRFLLDEERTRLAELGSDHFQRLSSGRYRFTADGSFDIVDLTTADAVRKSDSLSGGETFLASLALALALAEMVTRTGGRLDSFFLDEGFGTLDPEHLDLAMEGIEALVAEHPDRLVVVVSHVPELRQRLEDLIQLDRNSTTGDTKVIRA